MSGRHRPVWATCHRSYGCDDAPIARFIVTIEGSGWTDHEDVELPRLPDVGESLETKYGTLLIAEAEEAPDLAAYAGRILCRMS
ncbi:MAG TPA: hypothetical protein VGH46_11540 [Gaiellaceae bacterium]|jgi:hypothetical protein